MQRNTQVPFGKHNNRQHVSSHHEVATDVKQMPIRPIVIVIFIAIAIAIAIAITIAIVIAIAIVIFIVIVLSLWARYGWMIKSFALYGYSYYVSMP